MSWQPIETAPKDGSSILVFPATWDKKPCSIAHWNTDEYSKKPRPFWERDDQIQITYSRGATTTHWMPLPPPPEEMP